MKEETGEKAQDDQARRNQLLDDLIEGMFRLRAELKDAWENGREELPKGIDANAYYLRKHSIIDEIITLLQGLMAPIERTPEERKEIEDRIEALMKKAGFYRP